LPRRTVSAKALLLSITLSPLVCLSQISQSLNETTRLLNEGDFKAAKELAYDAYSRAEAAKSPELARAAYVYANTFCVTGNFDNATAYYEKAMELADVASDTALLIKVFRAFGTMRCQLEEFETGFRNLSQSIDLALSTNDTLELSASYQNMAIAKLLNNEIVESMDWNQKCADLAIARGNKTLLSICYNNIGQAYTYIEKFDSAAFFTNNAIELRIELGQPYYVNEYYENLAYLLIEAEDEESILQSQIEHYKLLQDTSYPVDSVLFDSKMYINESLLELQESKRLAWESEKEELISQKKQANRSTEKWRLLSLSLAILIIIILPVGFLFLRRNRDQWQTRYAEALSSLEELRATKAKEDRAIHEAVESFMKIIKILNESQNDLPHAPTFLFLTHGLNQTEIGSIIAKSPSMVSRYVTAIAKQMDMSTQELRKEAKRLGLIIWQLPEDAFREDFD